MVSQAELWYQAEKEASEAVTEVQLSKLRHAWRIARYNELMVEHGLIVADPKAANSGT